jgi:hypothetical protein
MIQPEKINRLFRAPQLTPTRIVVAMVIALAADALQILFTPLTFAFVPEIIDIFTLALIIPTIGFHILLLPTFLVELIPLADELPTWTGCVVAVILLRKREQWAATRADGNTRQLEEKTPPQ